MKFIDTFKHRRGLLLVGALVLTGGWAAIAGPQGLEGLLEKRREIRELQERNATLAAENAERRDRIRKMSGSPEEQEIIIRDQLKLAKPGETTFILPTPATDASKSDAPKSGTDSKQ
jgi:cell division protein FtsB